MNYELTIGNRIPSVLLNNLKWAIEHPTGIWADYNVVWWVWYGVYQMGQAGQIALSDVPNEPAVLDYPDLTSARSLPEDWLAAEFQPDEFSSDFLV